MKRDAFILLIIIFFIAFFLRVCFLNQNAISFAYDQARDAFAVKEILAGDIKILGPSVSGVPGLYHGVLYYYIAALGYFLGNGNPLGVSYLMCFISSLVVFVIYFFTYAITRKILPSLISSLMFAFSFEATQYANLLTNAAMGVWFVPLIYLGLYLWIDRKSVWAPALVGLALGLAIQSEFALGYHLLPVAFWLILNRKVITKTSFVKFTVSLILAVLPMLLVELKFGFKGVAGLVYLLSGQDAVSKQIEFGQFLIVYLNQLGKTSAYTIFPVNVAFGGLVGLLLILYSIKQKIRVKNTIPWQYFLVSILLAHLVVLPFGGSNMRHIMVGQVGIISVLLGVVLWRILNSRKIIMFLVVFILVSANLIKIMNENRNGQTIFPLQPDLTLANEIELVDYTYDSAQGQEFSINSLTSPLYINTLWSYLYNWYGYKHYSFLPYWSGKNQVDQPGNNLEAAPKHIKLHYYIIEPTYGIPQQYVKDSESEENLKSMVIEEKAFGDLRVQKRLLKIDII